jgi:hypothetical protein
VDEPEHGPALRLSKEAVLFAQSADECAHPVKEALPSVSVVVNVDLDVGGSQARHLCERLEELGPVFLLWIEETVAG